MTCKFLIFTLLFGVSFFPALSTAAAPRIIGHPQNFTTIALSGNALIQKACHGVGNNEPRCIATLKSAPPNQQANQNGLAFFILKFVEGNAANLSAAILKVAEDQNLSLMLQSTLSDCLNQYDPLDDLVEDAVNAVLSNSYLDAKIFIEAAISGTHECDLELTQDHIAEINAGSNAKDSKFTKHLKETNIFIKNILSASLNIIL